MNPTNSARIESAHEKTYEACTRLRAQYLYPPEEGEILEEIKGELWDTLNFNDVCSALVTEGAIDKEAFVRALREDDEQGVFALLEGAIQVYVEQWARKERDLSLWEAEEREAEEREWEIHSVWRVHCEFCRGVQE